MRRTIDAIEGLIRALFAAGMVAAFLWIVGAFDALDLTSVAAAHGRLTASVVGAVGGAWSAIPWRLLGGCFLLLILAGVVVATWSHIKRIYMLNRSVKIEMID